jgi:hypothetical protein
VDEGIANLTQAIELKPDLDDAMQYLQLTYHCHADLQCGDPTGISADLQLVDEWSKKATQARQEKEKNLVTPQPR